MRGREATKAQSWLTLSVALGVAVPLMAVHAASQQDPVAVAESAARAASETTDGKKFAEGVGQAFGRAHGATIQRCAKDTKRPALTDFDLFLRIDGNGVVEQALVKPSTNLATCVQGKMTGWKTAVPPRAGFWVKVGVNLKRKQVAARDGAGRMATSRWTVSFLLLASTILTGRGQTAAQRPQSPGPPMPFEDVGACPFEGCVYREWIANGPVTVRADRRPDAPIAFALKKGDHVQAITGIVVTVKPGRVQFRKPVDLSTTAGTLHVEPGETLYLLTYHGEGVTTAWFKGRLYDEVDGSEFINHLCEIKPGTCNGTIIEKPQRVWWIRLRNLKRLMGWTQEPEKFDNKDRFG
jgi:hypothetical protein